MAEPRILRIYLEPVMLKMAREGSFGFAAQVQLAFESRGFRVDYVRDTDEERAKSAERRGYALFLMKEPTHARALSMRRAYYYPFWRIERTSARWRFEIAEKTFDPAGIDTDQAEAWAKKWGRFLFRKGPENTERSGVIYVPLQGRLLEHRSFQSMSPVDMIAAVQAQAGARRILLGLHPGEDYWPEEREALERIVAADPRVSVQTGGMDEALRICDCVVTENSTGALSGLFFRKPAVLFARSDFHHIMPQVASVGVDEAFQKLNATDPPFGTYLYWFIQLGAIKADAPDAQARIIDTCQRHGWDL